MAWTQMSSTYELGYSILGAAVGGGWLLSVRQIYKRFRRVEALGLGDVKLAAAGGVWVGAYGLPQLILLAVLISLAIAIGLKVADRKVNVATRIPFGPGLAAAIWAQSANILPVETVQRWIFSL
jgi:leader peptidase (prepilin peptidase)/N-methyltransferase